MPYKSKAQQAKFHVLLEQGKISPKVVKEYDQASKGLNLPERVSPQKPQRPSKPQAAKPSVPRAASSKPKAPTTTPQRKGKR